MYLSENSYGGTSILTVAASDGDLSGNVNSQFTYNIIDAVGDEFFQVLYVHGKCMNKSEIDVKIMFG